MTCELLTADGLRSAIGVYRNLLRSHQHFINRLNVYPVPDGDTGTNMALTLESVCQALEGTGSGLDEVCQAISHGSLMGARGNSGVILSQILRGMSSVARESPEGLDGAAMTAALTAAATAAYGAVMRPVEGTILTVVRESSEGAAELAAGESLADVLAAALRQGTDALSRTPEMLPVLADAGVVDAGGTGFLLLLDALLHVVTGRDLPEAPEADQVHDAVAEAHSTDTGGGHGGGIADLRYEVMYLLDAPDETIPAFKDVWAGIGDSIVVVGGEGLWNCHIHTDDIGAAIEAAVDCGRPRNIRVTDLLEQVEEEKWVREGETPTASPVAASPVETAVVAVSVGDGIRRLFHSLGVQQIVSGGQSMNPSTAELIAAVEACPSDNVIILPNNGNIIPVALQVAQHTAKTVRVVPTRGVSEAVAALVSYDPHASLDDNESALGESAAAVTAGEITRAVRDSSCDVGPIAEGDWLGIARSGIEAVEESLATATTVLLDKLMNDDHEIVTLIEGDGSSVADTRKISAWIADHHPDVIIEVQSGGQPMYPYYIGIE